MVLAFWGIDRDQPSLATQLEMIVGAGVPGNKLMLLASPTLDVIYRSGELADLHFALNRGIPPIALVHTSELPYWSETTAHAVVILGLDDALMTLNDPAFPQAEIEISTGDFLLAWDEMVNLYALLQRK